MIHAHQARESKRTGMTAQTSNMREKHKLRGKRHEKDEVEAQRRTAKNREKGTREKKGDRKRRKYSMQDSAGKSTAHYQSTLSRTCQGLALHHFVIAHTHTHTHTRCCFGRCWFRVEAHSAAIALPKTSKTMTEQGICCEWLKNEDYDPMVLLNCWCLLYLFLFFPLSLSLLLCLCF